ncbi:MAG TPA: hypothetical protein VD929_05325 [Caulobacteraceae bacterium]|nr:hypothetical protein [Caulobacteraceae bacterium]
MDKVKTAKAVAEKLFATEAALDDAVVQATGLLQAMIEGRRALKLSAVAGEAAQSRVAESIAALAEARRAVMAAHGALANLQRKMDVDDNDLGPLDKPEEDKPRVQAPGLRAVG